MTTNRDIIKQAGGALAVAQASQSTAHPVKADAVWKWYSNGIPAEHWPLIIALTGVSLQTLYDLNIKAAAPDAPRVPRNSAEFAV